MNTPFRLTAKLINETKTYDLVAEYAKKFAQQRNEMLEQFLISLCPDEFTGEQERIRFLQNIEVRIMCDPLLNEDQIYSCAGLIAILKFEVKYNEQGALIAQHTLQRVSQ